MMIIATYAVTLACVCSVTLSCKRGTSRREGCPKRLFGMWLKHIDCKMSVVLVNVKGHLKSAGVG